MYVDHPYLAAVAAATSPQHPPRDYAVETGAKEGWGWGGGHIQWLTSSSHMVKPTEDLISLYVDVYAE